MGVFPRRPYAYIGQLELDKNKHTRNEHNFEAANRLLSFSHPLPALLVVRASRLPLNFFKSRRIISMPTFSTFIPGRDGDTQGISECHAQRVDRHFEQM